jgi:sugar/nucleoside kinase (ribokinase family)
MIENANVLGAGDMFASCFLLGLHNSMDDATAIDFAHRTTSKILKDLNEKI